MMKICLTYLLAVILFSPVDSLNQETSSVSKQDAVITLIEHQKTTLSLLSINIWFDSDDWPARFAPMLKEIREHDPDIIGLQEVIQRSDMDNQAQQIADSLGYYYYFDSVDDEGQDKRFGNAILSRYPIEETHFRALDPLDAYRKAVHAKIKIEGHYVDIYNTHLHNPVEATETRANQINDLHDFIEETSTSDIIFVTGDFNANPRWEEMNLMHNKFIDVYPLFHEHHLEPEHGTLNYHLGHTKRRIDYIFFAKHSKPFLTPLSAEIILDEPDENGIYPSDHFGVFAEFDITFDQ